MEENSHANYHLGHADFISVKASTVVRLSEHFVVVTEDGPIDLQTKITADFATIPEKYHEIFMNVLTSKYLNKVSFGTNPFSECRPIKRRRWWEFWRSKYFTS